MSAESPQPDIALKVECGNCGDAFWCHSLIEVGYLARDMHEHWKLHHSGNIHGPTTTVYERKASSHG